MDSVGNFSATYIQELWVIFIRGLKITRNPEVWQSAYSGSV